MFVWAKIPDRWCKAMSTMDFAMMLLEKGTWRSVRGADSVPPEKGTCGWRWSKTKNRLRQAVRQIKQCLRDAESQFAPSTADPIASPG
jgi:alanine-synthesizing transaminase